VKELSNRSERVIVAVISNEKWFVDRSVVDAVRELDDLVLDLEEELDATYKALEKAGANIIEKDQELRTVLEDNARLCQENQTLKNRFDMAEREAGSCHEELCRYTSALAASRACINGIRAKLKELES
jgi:chromosome segregation ATPase